MTPHIERFASRQAGSALIVSLIMLTLLTLFVLSAINSSTINLRIANNTQAQDEARAAARQAIETMISSAANITGATGNTTSPISVNNDTSGQTGDYSVTVFKPVCKRASKQNPPKTIQCANGAAYGVYCYDTLWEITATATRASTGASQTVTQGVSITFAPDAVPSSCS